MKFMQGSRMVLFYSHIKNQQEQEVGSTVLPYDIFVGCAVIIKQSTESLHLGVPQEPRDHMLVLRVSESPPLDPGLENLIQDA